MKIYVVEVFLDDIVQQCGFSLSRKKAQEKADELSDKLDSRNYYVTEYEVKDNSDYCVFE